MANFKKSQKKFSDAKRSFEEASKDVYRARQQFLMVEKRIALFLKNERTAELPANHPLNLERAEAAKKATASQAKLDGTKTALTTAREEFKALGTANQTITNLNDATPILLLPLRLQTRYLTTKYIARNIPEELLVDVNKVSQGPEIRELFPNLQPLADPLASISSQAYLLSNNPSPAVKELIQRIDAVIEGPAFQKRWLKTEDDYELCVRIFPDDLFLQTHETALTETEVSAAKIFWQGMWKAERIFRKGGTDPAAALKTKNDKQLEAWKAFRFDCLPHRASWAARIMRPADYPDNLSTDLEVIPEDKFPVPEIKAETWTLPPHTELLPEQFIVRVFFTDASLATKEVMGATIPDYVQLGFDPDETDENAFAEKNLVLELPKTLRWLTDLAEAETCGMAVRLPLTKAEFQSGISKIVVVGIKTAADPSEGSRLLTKLFDDHHYKPDGMAFLSQGMPTNNLPGQPAGFRRGGLSAEEAFRTEFPKSPETGPRGDGHRFATALGLNPKIFHTTFNHDGKDAEEALLINRALWPGTLGYYLDNLMRPTVTDADISFIKSFFQDFVAGRGLLPCFRAGKQPYGIVPAAAWSAWKTDPTASNEEIRLVRFLKKMDDQWGKFIFGVKTMKKVFSNTKEEVLKREFRQLLACQASSTRYFRRLIAGEYLLWNVNFRADPTDFNKAGILTNPVKYQPMLEGLNGWNEPVNPRPRILGKFMDDENFKLTDMPPGENNGIRPLTDKGKNYLALLLDATLEQLKESAFGDAFNKVVVQRTDRLMFNLARFALLQSWVEAATALVIKERSNISPLSRLDFEMEYVIGGSLPSLEHQTLLTSLGLPATPEVLKNKWTFFEQVLADGSRVDTTIAKKVQQQTVTDDTVKIVKEVRKSFTALADLPMERLERLFSEHIDLCSFRLDAWLQGLAVSRLFSNRKKAGFEKGIFLGSYGYLENLVPNPEPWVQVQEIEGPVAEFPGQAGSDNVVMPVYDFSGYTPEQVAVVRKFVFVYLGSDPVTFLTENPDTKNLVQTLAPGQKSEEGFLLTPSLEQAATAGILRAGYEHHAISQGPESKTLAVNIDSERTGLAMDMLKAIRAGHSLNEQIGYFIERKMYNTLELAQYVPKLRLAFPLHIERNEWDDNQKIGETEKIINLALVTDGLAILTKNENPLSIPAWTDKLQEIFGNDEIARIEFEKIVDQARGQFDAVSDLVLAESVFQMVKGSPERAAAALRMVGEGSDIMLPEVVQVPSENRVLTHRMGFVLNATGNLENAWAAGNSPLSIWSRLSPELNRWLADQLPSPEKIIATVAAQNQPPVKINLLSLGIQAIDFYYLMQKVGGRPEESLLHWLFTEGARKLNGMDAAVLLAVSYDRDSSFSAGEFSIREITPLIRTIGALLEKSRAMQPEDWQILSIGAEATGTDVYDNVSLRTACSEFANKQETGAVPVYLKKLGNARNELEQNLPKGFGSPDSEAAFRKLLRTIPEAYFYGVWNAGPQCPDVCNLANAKLLLDQATQIINSLEKRLVRSANSLAEIASQPPGVPGEQLFEMLSKLTKVLVGEDFIVLPKFRLSNAAEIIHSFNDAQLGASVGEFGSEEWLQGLAMVRDNARNYQVVQNLRGVLNAPAASRTLKILQLPSIPGVVNSWIGVKFPEGFVPPPNVTSMAFEFSGIFNTDLVICGLITDDWREKVPIPELTAGISINYNQANSEAPQCLLLVVPPEQKGTWEWEPIVQSVVETMTLAKKRAVDNEILQASWLNQFLPALVTPLDIKNNTPNLDFRVAGPAIRTVPTPDVGNIDDVFQF